MYLYVHIPYCLSKCDYCDFFSVPCGNRSIPDDYVHAVLNEVSYRVHALSIEKWDTIYIGGGTPSMLTAPQIYMLIDGIKRKVQSTECPQEITIEMNPETLTKEKLLVAQEAGASRLSLGIQSLSDNALSSVHRHCSAASALQALQTVHSIWKGRLNTDVIAGLPSTQEQYLETIRSILSFTPDHFSLYSLTVEEGTPLYVRAEKSGGWNDDESDRLWLLGRDVLEANGLHQYEVSNFAKRTFESVHNFAYWRQQNYMGCGAGACGTMYDFSGKPGVRTTNTTDIEKYISFWKDEKHIVQKETIPQMDEALSLDTEEFEFLMMGLRTFEGVNEKVYKKRFESVAPWHGNLQSRLESAGEVYTEFSQKKYLTPYKNTTGETGYRLTKEGILFLNTLLRALV